MNLPYKHNIGSNYISVHHKTFDFLKTCHIKLSGDKCVYLLLCLPMLSSAIYSQTFATLEIVPKIPENEVQKADMRNIYSIQFTPSGSREENSCKHGKHAWGTHKRKRGSNFDIILSFNVPKSPWWPWEECLNKWDCLTEVASLRLPEWGYITEAASLRLRFSGWLTEVAFLKPFLTSISCYFWGTYKNLQTLLEEPCT